MQRARRHHAQRSVVLVDSAMWLGATAKGRSSSRLRAVLRRAAALQRAGDLLVHLLVVPSEENPSAGASRGKRREHGACQFPNGVDVGGSANLIRI